MREQDRLLLTVLERLQEHERRIGGTEMKGLCTEVDAEKGICRIAIGKDEDGNDVLSPWVPYKQTAGAMKVHNPPSVGQPMAVRSETGDIGQGTAEPYRWNDPNPSPSTSKDDHVLTFGDVTIRIVSGGVKISVGGTSVDITGAGVDFTGGTIRHDGVIIDKTHDHGGIERGGQYTDPPRA